MWQQLMQLSSLWNIRKLAIDLFVFRYPFSGWFLLLREKLVGKSNYQAPTCLALEFGVLFHG